MNFPPPSEKQARVLWFSVTALAIGVMLVLCGLVFWALGWVLNALSAVLLPLAVAGIIAYLLDPVVDFFQRRGVPRLRAIVNVFVIGMAIILIGLATVVPQLVVETEQLIDQFPEYSKRLSLRANEWMKTPFGAKIRAVISGSPNKPKVEVDTTVTNLTLVETNLLGTNAVSTNAPAIPPGHERSVVSISDTLISWLTRMLPQVWEWILAQLGKVATWFGFVAGLALVPVYVFYFLLEKKGIAGKWTDYLPFRESRLKEEAVFVISSINECLIVFFRGQVLVAICTGTLLTIAFLLMGLNYAFLLGVMAAALGIVPYLGVMISLIPAVTLAAIQFGDWWHPVLVIGIFGLVQFLEGFVISPKIIGDRVGLHPLTIIIAVMVGTALLGGILGGVLAIPLTAALRAVMFRYVWRKKNEEPPPTDPGRRKPRPVPMM